MELDSFNCQRESIDSLPRAAHSSSSIGSTSSSSIDFKLSLASSASSHQSSGSSLPGASSIDSSILCLYTSCVFKNYPCKSLPSSTSTANSGITALFCSMEEPNLLLVGTEHHGFHQNWSFSRRSEDMGTSGGSVKAILVHQNRVFTAHQDGKIRIWNTKNTKTKNKRIYHEKNELPLELHQTLPTAKDVLLRSMLPSSYVQIRRHCKKLWIQHADAVSCLAATGDLVLSASWDRSIKLWRTTDWKCLDSIRSAHDDAINAIVASQQFVYTAAADGKIKAWEISPYFSNKKNTCTKRRMLSLAAVLERHKSSVNALALDPASGYLYSASSDRSIIAWEREETAMHMAAVDSLRGHSMAVLCLAASSTGGGSDFFLCSGAADRTIRVWSRDSFSAAHSCLCVIKGHSGPVKSVSMVLSSSIGHGARVVSGGLDCQVKSWWISLDGTWCPDDDDPEELVRSV